MHEQRCARKRAFCEQHELNVVAMCCSSAQHERFLLFLCRPLCVALRESPPGTLSKNRWSNGLYDRLEEWLPTNDGRFVHFDLLLRRQPLDASFCITLSNSSIVASVSFTSGRISVSLESDSSAAFFIHVITDVRDTPKVRSNPRRLLRSS